MITDEHLGEINDIIDRALKNPELLNKFETDFVSEWNDRLVMHGARVRISDKQQYVFDRILLKLDKAAEHLQDDAGDRSGDSAAVNLLEESGGLCPGGQTQPGAVDRP